MSLKGKTKHTGLLYVDRCAKDAQPLHLSRTKAAIPRVSSLFWADGNILSPTGF